VPSDKLASFSELEEVYLIDEDEEDDDDDSGSDSDVAPPPGFRLDESSPTPPVYVVYCVCMYVCMPFIMVC
jgi:hypothetical protein